MSKQTGKGSQRDIEIPITEMTLEEIFNVAQHLHRKGCFDDAEPLYRRILDVAPDQSDTIHFLGLLHYQRGDKEAGLTLVLRSIELGPDTSGRFNNLGNMYLEMQNFEQAACAFSRALELDPTHAEAYSNYGALLKAQGKFADAEQAYLKAIALNPEREDTYNNMGNLMMAQRRTREGVAYYCKALTLRPESKEAKRLLGVAYCTCGEIDKAAEVYREWLAQNPENPVAKHHLAACTGENVPSRAENAYIEQTFDAFAESFDAKLSKLEYRAPQLIANKVQGLTDQPEKKLIILDAGCGTGLCGPLIGVYAKELVGVDLSGGMLEKARARNVYSELIKAELTGYIASQRDRFDFIISADTLVYFGALDAVFKASRQALSKANPGARLIFTVEAISDCSDGTDFCIHPNGRYSHAEGYLKRTLADSGFSRVDLEPVLLRSEGGSPVHGFLVCCG